MPIRAPLNDSRSACAATVVRRGPVDSFNPASQLFSSRAAVGSRSGLRAGSGRVPLKARWKAGFSLSPGGRDGVAHVSRPSTGRARCCRHQAARIVVVARGQRRRPMRPGLQQRSIATLYSNAGFVHSGGECSASECRRATVAWCGEPTAANILKQQLWRLRREDTAQAAANRNGSLSAPHGAKVDRRRIDASTGRHCGRATSRGSFRMTSLQLVAGE